VTANCDKWRGITLLSLPSKVFTRVLLNRIKEHINLRLRKEQAAFRPNRSCIDQINTLRIITEQCIEWSSHLYTVFVNFEKAFNTIKREDMWKEVKRYGVPTQIVNLIKETYRVMRAESCTRVEYLSQFWYRPECSKVVFCHPPSF
jgi:hypothetical protein